MIEDRDTGDEDDNDFDVWLTSWSDGCYTILTRIKKILDTAGV